MHRWKRRNVATDSSAEQGLEVGRSVGGRRTPSLATGKADGATTRTDGNDTEATDAAMWKRLLTRGTLRRVNPRRGERNADPTAFGHIGQPPGNASNPKTGSGAQQTRRADAEQAAEVVRNHEGGTRSGRSHRRTEGSASFREWTRRKTDGEGVPAGESHERKDSDLFGGREESWP
jgi:hypothetical protein